METGINSKIVEITQVSKDVLDKQAARKKNFEFWGPTPKDARKAAVAKKKGLIDKRTTIKEAVDKYVKDGMNIGIGGFVNTRVPTAIAWNIIKKGVKDLTLSFQSISIINEWLAGAMLVSNSNHISIKRVELSWLGYEAIGIGAPILLVFARLLQGLSVGGEYGTSATYLSEMATKERRGFYSSFQYVTLISGQLIALAVLIVLQQVLTTEQLYAWGWRIPFAIGALCAVVALYLRRGMEETESFTKKEKAKESAMRTLMRHPKELMTVVGLTMGGTLAFYTYTTYMQKYLVNTVGMSISDSTTISAATLFLFMCLQPIIGGLSDKIGRRPILIAFGVLGTLFTVPILTTLHTIQSWWGAFFLIMAALIIVSGYTSINAVVKAELFPTEIRALGVGLPYALTVSIFGGTAEYIALWFKSIGMETGYYWYVTACIAVSLMVYVTMKDTRKHSRITTD